MNSEVAAIRNELKGLGVRNSFRGATKNYMAELLNRLKHTTVANNRGTAHGKEQ